jgi:hypothetical protein
MNFHGVIITISASPVPTKENVLSNLILVGYLEFAVGLVDGRTPHVDKLRR